MTIQESDSWTSWSRYVLKMLQILEKNQESYDNNMKEGFKQSDQAFKELEKAISDGLGNINVEIARLKTAATIRGTISGAITSGAVLFILWILSKIFELQTIM